MNNDKPVAVITGAGSGIGLATSTLLISRGWRVIGIDLHNTLVVADLSKPAGRSEALKEIQALCPDSIDAVITCAGVGTPSADIASINYFGSISILDGLRFRLAKAAAPRAVAVSSFASILPSSAAIVEACRQGDEAAARVAVGTCLEAEGGLIYASTKQAISRWVRQEAVTQNWAGAGVLLNAVAPGTVVTPMSASAIAQKTLADGLRERCPRVIDRLCESREVAELIAFLASPLNSYIAGQVIFIDGGAEARLRPSNI